MKTTLARDRQAQRQRLRATVQNLQDLMFPCCVMRFSNFRQNGRMMSHETTSDAGKLKFLYTWSSALDFAVTHPIVFISHQWTGFSAPDASGVQYAEMVVAVQELCEAYGHAETDLYIWLDFHSIPQLNVHLKRAAIASIAVYAAVCRFFLVIAPETYHVDTGAPIGPDSYSRRGWTRVEQWSNLAMGGLSNAFLLRDGALQPLASNPEWVRASVQVFHGDFTVDSDKLALVDVLLGLYGFSLLDDSGQSTALLKHVNEMRDTVFPKKYFGDLLPLLELFVRVWKSPEDPQEWERLLEAQDAHTDPTYLDKLANYLCASVPGTLRAFAGWKGLISVCLRKHFTTRAGAKDRGKSRDIDAHDVTEQQEHDQDVSFAHEILRARSMYSKIKRARQKVQKNACFEVEAEETEIDLQRRSLEAPNPVKVRKLSVSALVARTAA